jgi:hypothetical protein
MVNPMIFNITFPLPFKIPISKDKYFASGYISDQKQVLFKLTFATEKGSIKFPWNDTEETIEITMATTEMNFLDIPSDTEVTEALIKMAFKNGLDYLNRFIDALRLAVEASKIYNITVAHLPDEIDVLIEGKYLYLYSTFIEDELSNTKDLSSEVCSEILANMKQWDMFPEIMVVERFFQNAKTFLMRDQFSYAVIEFQTSFELFLRNSYRYILNIKSTPIEEVEKLVSIRNLKAIITDKLGPILNVDLSYVKPGPMKEWNENLYILRNNIVHNGKFEITREQALKAQDAYVNARNYIVDCMVSSSFMDSNRKVKLSVFKPSIANKELEDKINARLFESGYLPKDKPIKLLGKLEEEK